MCRNTNVRTQRKAYSHTSQLQSPGSLFTRTPRAFHLHVLFHPAHTERQHSLALGIHERAWRAHNTPVAGEKGQRQPPQQGAPGLGHAVEWVRGGVCGAEREGEADVETGPETTVDLNIIQHID